MTLPLWEPTLWAIGFVVGAHPCGRLPAIAVCEKSPKGLDSCKHSVRV
jgi:hypothetical protein